MRRASSAVRAAVGRVSRSPARSASTASSSSSWNRGGSRATTKAADSRSMSWPASAAANAPRSYHVGSVRPASMCGPGSSMLQLPRRAHDAACGTPRDDRCPSPTARRLRTNRHCPGSRPVWSGCATADGLNRAAASTEYSWVNQAPTRLRRSSDSVGVVGYPVRDPRVVRHQHARQVPVARRVAVTHPLQRRADLVLGQREDPRQHPRRPGPAVVRELLTGHEQPRQHPRRVRRQDDSGPRDALRRPTLRHPDDLHRAPVSGGRGEPWTGPAAASRAAPTWTPRPGSRCARRAADRRSRLRSPDRASGCRSR